MTLEKRYNEVYQKYGKKSIPRPPYWSGFRLIPNHIEFWKAKPFRLHERSIYENKGEGWKKSLLFP
jgi:pyridoxamine 5'-phosphate oxidase